MALSNAQYDEIMHEYNKRQLRTDDELNRRTEEVFLKAPEYKRCLDEISSISVAATKAKLRGDASELLSLNNRINSIRSKMQNILAYAGFPANYLLPVYTCKDCKDTGFIDNKKCHCFLQAEINLLYNQSNIKNILDKENFDTLSYSHLTNSEDLRRYKEAVASCKDFVANFPSGKNILLTGNTGVGKTFLTNCMAKGVLDKFHSVIYLSAIELFDYFSSKYDFNEHSGLDNLPHSMQIIECDLLIIDDLGTELTNSFTNSKLFYCINQRILENRSTIISTNYTIGQFAQAYSERIFSRISQSYKVIQIVGDDIRMK